MMLLLIFLLLLSPPVDDCSLVLYTLVWCRSVRGCADKIQYTSGAIVSKVAIFVIAEVIPVGFLGKKERTLPTSRKSFLYKSNLQYVNVNRTKRNN